MMPVYVDRTSCVCTVVEQFSKLTVGFFYETVLPMSSFFLEVCPWFDYEESDFVSSNSVCNHTHLVINKSDFHFGVIQFC